MGNVFSLYYCICIQIWLLREKYPWWDSCMIVLRIISPSDSTSHCPDVCVTLWGGLLSFKKEIGFGEYWPAYLNIWCCTYRHSEYLLLWCQSDLFVYARVHWMPNSGAVVTQSLQTNNCNPQSQTDFHLSAMNFMSTCTHTLVSTHSEMTETETRAITEVR